MPPPTALPEPLPAEVADRCQPGERFRTYALAGLTLALIGLCVVLAVPFLPALTWGVALAIIAGPVHTWFDRRLARPAVSAALTTALVTAVILGAGTFVSYHLAREAGNAVDQANRAEGAVHEAMARTPGLDRAVGWMDRVGVDVDREARRLVDAYTRDVSGIAQGSLAAVFQFVVVVFVLFHLFKDRPHLRRAARELLPLTKDEADRVFARIADSVHANLYATLVTSLVDGVGGGLMFWAVGLPAPVLWGVVMFVLSFLPIVGTFLVWLPAAAFLALTGRWVEALILIGWGVASWVVVDYVLYVRLAGDRLRLHQIPALIAFIGGLVVFGAAGMILGPAVLAVTVALLDVWRRRILPPADSMPGVTPGPIAPAHRNGPAGGHALFSPPNLVAAPLIVPE